MNDTGHWYRPDGSPAHFIECKTRAGTRPTTISDARKLGLFPSVTNILSRTLAKPALVDWLIKNAVIAAMTTPQRDGESTDEFVERILAKDAKDESRKAMDLGSEIHAALEEHIAGRLFAPQFKPFLDGAMVHVNALGRVLHSEKVLVHPDGFAGRTDCILEKQELLTVLDFKTTKKLPTKAAYAEHVLQVAAYGAALGNSGDTRIQTAVLYISTLAPGETALFVQEDWQRHWTMFKHVFELFKFLNDFDPKQTPPLNL